MRHLLRFPNMLQPRAFPSVLPVTRCHWSKDKHFTGPWCPFNVCKVKEIGVTLSNLDVNMPRYLKAFTIPASCTTL